MRDERESGSKGFEDTLEERRFKGASRWEKARGPEGGAWQSIMTNEKPGYRAKHSPDWNDGYDGTGKGTW